MAEPYRDNPIRKSLEARAVFFYANMLRGFGFSILSVSVLKSTSDFGSFALVSVFIKLPISAIFATGLLFDRHF